MSKLTECVLGVFDNPPKVSGSESTQIGVGRVGRLLKTKEFSGANGSEGNHTPSDQETSLPQAHSDHSDHFLSMDGSERFSAEKESASGFGETYTLVREVWAMPGERAFHLDGRTRARTRLADACPAGIDLIRWRHAIEAAGALMAKVRGGVGPVITFRDAADSGAMPDRCSHVQPRPLFKHASNGDA
jgi:hypothetical protein